MIVHCPSCGIGIDADADAELAMAAACADRDAAIRELAAVRAELAAIKARRCGTCMHWWQVIGPPGEQDKCRLRKHVGPRRQDWHCADWTPKGGE